MAEGEDQVAAKGKSNSASRAPRYTQLEKVIILSCIEPWKKIVENVRTNARVNEAKADAWKQITLDYAEESMKHDIKVPRSTDQLKAFWKAEKKKSRDIDSVVKTHAMGTGGGDALELDATTSSINSLVHTIQPALDFTLENSYDSSAQFEDQHQDESEPSEVPVNSESSVKSETLMVKNDPTSNEDLEKKLRIEDTIDLTEWDDPSTNGFVKDDPDSPNEESDEDDLMELHKKLIETARLKRIAERAAHRENLLNEIADDEQDYSKNKKDQKPSKQQRKIHGNPKIKVEKMKVAAKTRVAAKGKSVAKSFRDKKLNKNRVSQNLALRLKYFNPSGVVVPNVSKGDVQQGDSRVLPEPKVSKISADESPSKILSERQSDDLDNYSSECDSPKKNPINRNKLPGILKRRMEKCQENCDPHEIPTYKKINVQPSASELEQEERLRRVQESRDQQREAHQQRMRTYSKEDRYWDIKLETATLERDFVLARQGGKESS
ncbi:hypothetical protein QAD02_012554 [Eretmocerus hayati]|uniref:Uncharacterized protein n=1 Tax=Eretmocerus hayati TaxID=131215 RepID=A0ACC2P2U4_9HYME|nr:hypothetical protein QAD02_012554 [Eretmocerus hayati]